MNQVAVAPHCRYRGFDGVRQEVHNAYEVLELNEALNRTYDTDAHLVAYVVPGLERQPRINKPGLPHLGRPVQIDVLLCDVDNPDHACWDGALLEKATAQYDTLDILQTTGIYHTAHGSRIVQPIDTPIPVSEVEPYILRWFKQLSDAGLAVDWACKDWTRHYRLPHVRREGVPYRSPLIRLDSMRSISIEPLPTLPCADSPTQSAQSEPTATPPRPIPNIDWTQELPSIWTDTVNTIATAVKTVQTEWHTLFLAIAGALLSKGIPPEHIPAICRAISLATGQDTRTKDRVECARSTVARFSNKQAFTGLGTLRKQWPEVAFALEKATATGSLAKLHAQADAKPKHPIRPLKKTLEEMEEAIRNAPPGVSLFGAECGLGKTAIALKIAAARAATPHVSKNAAGLRAPPLSKTAISVDKNRLARQTQYELEKKAVSVKRIFGPLSVKDEDNQPVCIYHNTAQHLVAGGQSLQREICEGRKLYRCSKYDTCEARTGFTGPQNARVITGPHQLVSVLNQEAGNTGLLVIDEPPDLLETTYISMDDLDCTMKVLSAFSSGFALAIKPSLLAVRAWLERPEAIPRFSTIKEAIRRLSPSLDSESLRLAQQAADTPQGDAADCAAEAPLLDPRSKAPPIRLTALTGAKANKQRAMEIGTASKVLGCLYHAITAPWPVRGDVDTFSDTPLLMVTTARRKFMEALRREGPVVIMDANIETNAPIYKLALEYEPPLHLFPAQDGAPISRTLIRCSAASRKHWLDNGRLQSVPSLIQAFRAVFDWLAEKPDDQKLGLITFLPIQLALECILHPNDKTARQNWKNHDQPRESLDKLQKALSPLLANWKGQIRLGHFGNVRGMNDMASVDALVTLGDPWPNIGQVEREVYYIKTPELLDARCETLCRAELEQAQGRLRPVHRTRPGRALHIGKVLPGGSGWCGGNVEIRQIKKGRPPSNSAMSPEEFEEIVAECGGIKAAARRAGCDPKYLRQCRTGERSISPRLASALRGKK